MILGVSETRGPVSSDVGLQSAPCRRSSEPDPIGSSFILRTEMSHGTCMWNATRIGPSSGSIPDGWPRVAASAELRSAVEALVRDNAVQRRRAWDEHFTE